MSRFFTISPAIVPENPVLFPMMRPHFIAQGHSFVSRIEEADCGLFDLHVRHTEYNQDDIDKMCWWRKPIATFDEYDKGGMSTLDWPEPLTKQQQDIFDHIKRNNIKSVHFCRLLNKNKEYPPALYPYEVPILYEEPICTPDELFGRPYDIVWLANHSPSREKIAEVLLSDGRLKCHIRLGQQKIPFEDYAKEHKRGKLFITSQCGGFTDERKQTLFSIAGIIQDKTDQLVLHRPVAMRDCIEISPEPTKDELDYIYDIVNDKEMLYKIYKNGYDFMKKYYDAGYIANYFLSCMKQEGIL